MLLMSIILINTGEKYKAYHTDEPIINGDAGKLTLIADVEINGSIKCSWIGNVSNTYKNMVQIIGEIAGSLYKNVNVRKFDRPVDADLECIDYNLTKVLSNEENNMLKNEGIDCDIDIELMKIQATKCGQAINSLFDNNTRYIDFDNERPYKYENIIDGALVISKHLSVYDCAYRFVITKYVGIVKKYD